MRPKRTMVMDLEIDLLLDLHLIVDLKITG